MKIFDYCLDFILGRGWLLAETVRLRGVGCWLG